MLSSFISFSWTVQFFFFQSIYHIGKRKSRDRIIKIQTQSWYNIQKREKRHTEDKGIKRYGERERDREREKESFTARERDSV